jgi:uncharacterized protein
MINMKEFDPHNDPGPVPSPCIDVCKMNVQTGFCDGCLRTLDEIACWSSASDDIKRAVWAEIERRRDVLFGGS